MPSLIDPRSELDYAVQQVRLPFRLLLFLSTLADWLSS